MLLQFTVHTSLEKQQQLQYFIDMIDNESLNTKS
jgi:hypothetical protein